MSDDQTKGREDNGAVPGGKPEAATSRAAVKRSGERSTRAAGPDGSDATEIGDTFKKTGPV